MIFLPIYHRFNLLFWTRGISDENGLGQAVHNNKLAIHQVSSYFREFGNILRLEKTDNGKSTFYDIEYKSEEKSILNIFKKGKIDNGNSLHKILNKFEVVVSLCKTAPVEFKNSILKTSTSEWDLIGFITSEVRDLLESQA